MQEFFEAREYLRRVGDYRSSRILCEGSEQRFAFVGITDRVVFLRIGETLVQLYRSERCRARVCRNDFSMVIRYTPDVRIEKLKLTLSLEGVTVTI